MAESCRKVCIALTVYRVPVASERLSIQCLRNVLREYDLFLVKPASLSLSLGGFTTVSLPDQFFESKITYGLMLASSEFYKVFVDYEWLLIYHPDCLVFRNSLEDWVESRSDYLSSVCFADSNAWAGCDFVGFGGLSLRRTKACLETMAIIEADPILRETHRKSILTYGQEDVFWSWTAPEVNKNFSVLPVVESLAFAWNGDPRPYARRFHGVPFACHGFLSLYAFLFYWNWLPLSFGERVVYGFPALIQILGSEAWSRLVKARLKFRISACPR